MSDLNTAPGATTNFTNTTTANGTGSAAHASAQSEQQGVTTWPHLAEGLYTFLTGRGAVIEYTFENMEVHVPRDTAPNAPAARWKMNGTIRIRTYEPGTGGSAKP